MTSQLKFNKSLTSSKPKDIINSLKSLHEELSTIEQETLSLQSLNKIKSQLISSSLISSKDAGIRAFLSCCLADILRLYAPDSPFDQTDLNQIFLLFINEIKRISNTSSTYYKQYLYLLEDIVQIQCIALVAELPDKDNIVDLIFKTGYKLLEDDKMTNSTEYLIISLLSQVIDEVESLPFDTIRLILEQFLRNPSNSTYKASKTLCSENTNSMIRMTHYYFTEIFNQFQGISDQDIISNDSFQTELDAINNILVEIWRSNPQILNNVMKQLEQYLMQDISHLRSMLVLTIGQILQNNGSINFVNEFSSIYSTWLSRSNDKEAHVRSTWASCAGKILVNNNENLPDVVFGLEQLLQDTDEQVRLEACQSISEIKSIDIFVDKIFPYKNLISVLCDRLRDKKPSVRNSTFEVLADIFDLACKSSLNDSIAFEFGEIPSKFIDLTYINDLEINQQVDIILFTRILPDTLVDDIGRTKRLLTICHNLSKSSLKVLEMMCKRQDVLSKALNSFLKVIEDSTQDEFTKQSKLNSWISWFSKQLNHSEKARNALIWFSGSDKTNLHEMMKSCLDIESDCSTVLASLDNLKQELEKQSKQWIFEILRIFIYRGGYFLFNKSFIGQTLSIAIQIDHPMNSTAYHYIEFVGHYQPRILHEYIRTNNGWFLSDFSIDIGSDSLKIMEILLQSCSDVLIVPNEFWDMINEILLIGDPTKVGLAVRILRSKAENEDILKDLLKSTVKSIREWSNEDGQVEKNTISRHLSILLELYDQIPSDIEEYIGDLSLILVNKILMNESFNGEGTTTSANLDTINALTTTNEFYLSKILSLRILTARLLAIKQDNGTARDLLQPMLELLKHFSKYGQAEGDDKRDKDDKIEVNQFKALIRLETGLCLLQLSKQSIYDNLITATDIQFLVNLVNDPSEILKDKLIHEIIENLSENQLNENRFFIIPLFIARDKNEDLKSFVSTWIRAKSEREKNRFKINNFIEKSFIRFIVHLGHLKDEKGMSTSDLNVISEYLIYFLSLLADEQNIASLLHVSTKIMHFDDKIASNDDLNEHLEDTDMANSETNGPNITMYQIAQVAQICITSFKDYKSWRTIPFTGKIDFPSDVVSSSTDSINNSFNSSILTEEQMINLQENITKQLKKINRKVLNSRQNQGKSQTESKNQKISKINHVIQENVSDQSDDDDDDDDSYKAPFQKKLKLTVDDTRRSTRTKHAVSYKIADSEEDSIVGT